MTNRWIALTVASLFAPLLANAAAISSIEKVWTYNHTSSGISGIAAEISAYDVSTHTIWVAGVVGVDVLDATSGALLQHINTTGFGSINSIAIKNGMAAFAIESNTRSSPGIVQLYDTSSRGLLSGTNTIQVGALPDMLRFTEDGSKLLVANEGTPDTYGTRVGTTIPRNFAPATNDPAGSVSIIDVGTRSLLANAGFAGVATSGSNIRTNTGMDYEPEYIAINSAGTKAYVTLQEANAMGVLNIETRSFEKIIGLGAKDYSLPGNQIDPLNDGNINFISANVKGLYMPDGIEAYEANGQTVLVMANEGDFREDDGDRTTAGALGASTPLNNLRVTNTDSSAGDYYSIGARSFSLRNENGDILFDSGDQLDKKAAELGIYDDARSRDKGVEPEGVELLHINGRVIAAIGLERTKKSAIALYDITDPTQVSFLDMIVSDGDLAPEGLEAFFKDGHYYLVASNESSKTTSMFKITPVPESEIYAMLLAGFGIVRLARRKQK